MTDTESQKELGLKGSSSILGYIQKFSATEKTVFGLLSIALIVSALVMADQVNGHFMTEIPAYGGELREGLVGLPHAVNPVLAIADVDRDITSLIYSGLMRYSEGKLVPDLAKSYSVSEDGLTYSFILRPEAKFQDGIQLTADDVAFTIQKIQDPATKSPRYSDWKSVTVMPVSATEIKFVLKQPYSPFLGNATLGILPKHIWKDISNDQFVFSKYNVEAIGSGPYKVSRVDYDANVPVSYILGTWEQFYGDIPYITNITLNFFPDSDKALAALEAGNIDSLPSVAASQAKTTQAGSTGAPFTILSTPLPRIFGLFFNQSDNPILADKNIRQALSLAVDRNELVDNLLGEYGLAINGPLPNPVNAAAAPLNSKTLSPIVPQDLAKAQSLIEKSGWTKNPDTGMYQKKSGKNMDDLSFEIFTADTPDLKQTAELLSSYWKKVGVETNIKVFDPSDLYQNVIRTRKYDSLLFGELVGKDHDIYAFWHSSQIKSPGLNVALYANAKADKLLDDLRLVRDDTVRSAKYAELNSLITYDIPAIFLYSPDFLYAVPKTLKGISFDNITIPADRFASVQSWYISTEKVWKIFDKTKNNNQK